jgi:hypothetical protein
MNVRRQRSIAEAYARRSRPQVASRMPTPTPLRPPRDAAHSDWQQAVLSTFRLVVSKRAVVASRRICGRLEGARSVAQIALQRPCPA